MSDAVKKIRTKLLEYTAGQWFPGVELPYVSDDWPWLVYSEDRKYFFVGICGAMTDLWVEVDPPAEQLEPKVRPLLMQERMRYWRQGESLKDLNHPLLQRYIASLRLYSKNPNRWINDSPLRVAKLDTMKLDHFVGKYPTTSLLRPGDWVVYPEFEHPFVIKQEDFPKWYEIQESECGLKDTSSSAGPSAALADG